MIISITALAAAFAPLLTDAQAEVNGAFKPLVSAEYKKAKSLDVSDAFARCQKVQEHATKLREVAEEGLEHLSSVRDGYIDVREFPEGFDVTLETLATAVTQFINLTRDMFDTAEKSTTWAGNYNLLKPLKKQMMSSLALLRSSATQIAIEIRQANNVVDNAKLIDDRTSEDAIKRLVNKSHMMLGVDAPRWS